MVLQDGSINRQSGVFPLALLEGQMHTECAQNASDLAFRGKEATQEVCSSHWKTYGDEAVDSPLEETYGASKKCGLFRLLQKTT